MNSRNMDIGKIKPFGRNPRVIPQAAVDQVARSIERYGFLQPIVVDRDGVIVAGHTRYQAARKLGLDEVPTVHAKDLTPQEAREFRLADNRLADMTLWDVEALHREVADLPEEVDIPGFGSEELRLIAMDLEDIEEPENDQEDLSEEVSEMVRLTFEVPRTLAMKVRQEVRRVCALTK